jgi:hypothetical protein
MQGFLSSQTPLRLLMAMPPPSLTEPFTIAGQACVAAPRRKGARQGAKIFVTLRNLSIRK